jgi:GTP-binding nuclear protein Ran
MRTYKLLLVGNSGVGKTTYVKKLLTGEFTANHTPTLGVEVHPIIFQTNKGPIRFCIWDTAGIEKNKGLFPGYCVGADCLMVICDQKQDLQKWLLDVMDACSACDSMLDETARLEWNWEDMPKVVCANNTTFDVPKVEAEYFEINAADPNNTAPFLYLARQLTEDPSLEFVQ